MDFRDRMFAGCGGLCRRHHAPWKPLLDPSWLVFSHFHGFNLFSCDSMRLPLSQESYLGGLPLRCWGPALIEPLLDPSLLLFHQLSWISFIFWWRCCPHRTFLSHWFSKFPWFSLQFMCFRGRVLAVCCSLYCRGPASMEAVALSQLVANSKILIEFMCFLSISYGSVVDGCCSLGCPRLPLRNVGMTPAGCYSIACDDFPIFFWFSPTLQHFALCTLHCISYDPCYQHGWILNASHSCQNELIFFQKTVATRHIQCRSIVRNR